MIKVAASNRLILFDLYFFEFTVHLNRYTKDQNIFFLTSKNLPIKRIKKHKNLPIECIKKHSLKLLTNFKILQIVQRNIHSKYRKGRQSGNLSSLRRSLHLDSAEIGNANGSCNLLSASILKLHLGSTSLDAENFL